MVETNDPSGKRALRAALRDQLRKIDEERKTFDHRLDPGRERDLSAKAANVMHRLRKAD